MKQLLTGKCLSDFEAYCKNEYDSDDYIIVNGFGDRTTFYSIITWHEKCPVEMQFGVIQDFADSKGMYIQIAPKWDYSGYLALIDIKSNNDTIYCNSANDGFIPYKSLEQAREEVIKQFNKIYNRH